MNPKEVTRAFNALQQGIIARGSGKSILPDYEGLMELAMAGHATEEEQEQHRHEMKMKSRRFIARKCGKRGRY
ncbi:hypothetical protein LWL40_27570 (plasmid) [Bacillus thuringiensis]|uniref:hypothetical protein n=1 Tax=Bacillus thuringiensis TaxID=1428 RepID=UPI003D73958F